MGLLDLIGHKYPFTDFHELNLDWCISAVLQLQKAFEDFSAGNKLIFANPLQHDLTKTYAKNTIVVDSVSGTAYLSLDAVPVGVQLDNADYWLPVFDFASYVTRANQNFTDNYFSGTDRAPYALAVGDWVVLDDVLYKVTVAMAADDLFIIGTNIVHFTVEQFLKDFITSVNNTLASYSLTIQQYKNDIDASELAYRQQLAQDIANTTASLQAQLDAVIAGATVDSEVIDARVGYNTITYSSLGNAIRSQFTGVVSAIDESLDELHGAVVYDPYNIFISSDMESGAITSQGVDEANVNFYRNSTYQRLPSEATNLICNYNYFVAIYDIEKNFIVRLNANGNNAVTLPSGAYYFRMIIAKSVYDAYSANIIVLGDNYAPTLNLPFAAHYTIKNSVSVPQINPPKNLYIFNDFESGTITGAGVDEANSYFERNATYHKIENFGYLTTNTNMYIAYYDIGKHFIQRDSLTADTPSAIPSGAYYYRLLIVATTNTAHKNMISVRYGTHAAIEHNCNIAGKGFYYYRFGGNGIDWCFVHTPSGYDPNRPQPYPFIICNHGNGWTMDGTPQKANWTDYTMYVPVGEAEPGKYQNETADSSLWYSNPTIEELLSDGFVVCGCENYADSLYGNENCRKACVDFFDHMVKNYNVTPYCGMIGSSNGAQTSINAAFYLQNRVRAMVLQYPLTCLVNQYFYNTGQQAGIRSAYNISNPTPTESELIEATATHDVLHTNIADGKRVDVFPPTKLYYSLGDDVTPASENAIPLRDLLQDSTKIVEEVIASGGHGSSTHFDPSGFADFFGKFM